MSSEEARRLGQNFPKQRPPLSNALRRIYEQEYIKNREGIGLVGWLSSSLEGWMHRTVAREGMRYNFGPILELGAGTLNHLQYEPRGLLYDVVEPFDALVQVGRKRANIRDHYVRNHYESIEEIPDDVQYSRILSIATLEHVVDLPSLLKKAALLLSPGGLFQAAIPSEGSALWYAGWRYGTGVEFFIRTGLSYKELMQHEHLNNASEIEHLIANIISTVKIVRFPFSYFHFSLYTYIQAMGIQHLEIRHETQY